MADALKRPDIDPDPVFLARKSFIGALETLAEKYPETGFGVSLMTHTGEQYLLANSNMAFPEQKSQGFSSERKMASLDNGQRFAQIEVHANAARVKELGPKTEAQMLGDILDLIMRIEGARGLPAGRLASTTAASHATTTLEV